MKDKVLIKIEQALDECRKEARLPNAERRTITSFCEQHKIPRATLYRKYSDKVDEFKKIQDSVSKSYSTIKLDASRDSNKALRNKLEIVTTVAHELYTENLKLKEDVARLKKSNIRRIK